MRIISISLFFLAASLSAMDKKNPKNNKLYVSFKDRTKFQRFAQMAYLKQKKGKSNYKDNQAQVEFVTNMIDFIGFDDITGCNPYFNDESQLQADPVLKDSGYPYVEKIVYFKTDSSSNTTARLCNAADYLEKNEIFNAEVFFKASKLVEYRKKVILEMLETSLKYESDDMNNHLGMKNEVIKNDD